MVPAVVKDGGEAENRFLLLHLASFWSVTLLLREGSVGRWGGREPALAVHRSGVAEGLRLPGCGNAERCHLV